MKELTIVRNAGIREAALVPDDEALAFSALAWLLADDDRAQRLLAITGLAGEDLRSRLGERAVLAAILGHLEAHQPDLIAAATALDVDPGALVAARERLAA